MKQSALKGKIIAAVRIRGRVNVRSSIEETMDRLNLKRVNNCTIIKVNDPYLGMLKKCVNHIAYGEVDEDTLAKLVAKFKLNVDPKGIDQRKGRRNGTQGEDADAPTPAKARAEERKEAFQPGRLSGLHGQGDKRTHKQDGLNGS